MLEPLAKIRNLLDVIHKTNIAAKWTKLNMLILASDTMNSGVFYRRILVSFHGSYSDHYRKGSHSLE